MINRLFILKLVHSVIFIFQSLCLLYILYCAVTGTFNWILLVAIVAILVNGLVLLLNRWRCPFTTIAERLGTEKGSVTDIFLLNWMARNVFRGSAVLFFIELVLLAFRYFMKF